MQNQSNILKVGIQKFIVLLKKIIQKIKFRIKLMNMDMEWRIMGGGCFGFPPSFYYTHTEEEIERIIKELREFLMDCEDEK